MRRASCWETPITTPRTCARSASKRSDFWSPPNVGPTRTPTVGWRLGESFTSCVEEGQRELQSEHFKSIFDVHGQVPTKGRVNTARFALGAVFVYQLALLHRHERKSEVNRGLKPFLRAA